MKKRLLLVLVLAVLPLFAGSMTRTVSYDLRDLTFSKANDFDVVNLPGVRPLVKPGDPSLPHVVQAVAIPAGADPTSVELIAEDWIDVPGTFRIAPSQPDIHLPRVGETFNPTIYPPNPEVYASGNPYPETKIRLTGSGTMSGFRMANLELFPVRYIPASGKLQLATRLVYRLSYAENRVDARVATRNQQDLFGNAVRAMVANPEDVDRFAPRISRSTSTTLPPGNYEYVVITEAPLDTVFQRLAAWKTLKGVPGTVVLVSWIGTNYTGYDLQEKIRNFIIDAHATWGTMYVLLGGQGDYNSSGQNIVPTRMGNYEGEDEPCDLYYAGLDGTWDANNNHTYGEIADNTDMCSDIYVGRAPVYNTANTQTFVHKVINYEQNPPANYVKHMILPTGVLWSSYEERPMVESIARQTPTGWSDQRLYERTGALSNQAVMDSMNAGVGMGHWDGHGNESGIYMNGGSVPFFTSTDADALHNGDKLGIHVSIACDCCAWDWVTNGDCLAEHIVMNPNGGGIASIMNTRYGYGAIDPQGNYTPGPSERLDTTFYGGVFDRGMPHTGEALGFSKAYWSPWADSLYRYDQQRYCIYDLNLIGDPETQLYTQEPANCNVAHPAVITIGSHIQFTVTVSTIGFAPIEGARVLARKGTEVNVLGTTNSSGQVTLDVSPVTPGPMSVTVNAHNYFVHIDTCQVISTARYVAWLRSTIDDASPGGNGDGILNPGETVEIPTWVKNWGTLGANSVSARLRTHDPNAQVLDSLKSFGNIAAGDSAFTGSDGYNLHVNSGLVNGYSVACSLVCKDALDSSWVSIVTFTVGAPVLVRRTVSVRDSATGNGNGRIDPDETAELVITLANTGGGHGYNCQAVLRSADPRLQVLDSLADYGTINRGDSAGNSADRFTVYADGSIPPETPISCALHFTADGGYVGTAAFNLVVGELRTVDPIPDGPRTPSLYYAYDEVDVGYPAHPTYAWIEINGVGTQLYYAQNDDVLLEDLPTGFGPFKFYGQQFSQISISADGWICPGNYTTSNYTNQPIPGSGTPPGMVCGNWDDLSPYPDGSGYIYWYHDVANHRLVMEWDNVTYWNQSVTDKFEIIFYDTTVTTPSGDNQIVVQYMTANGYTSSTLGIEDPTQAIGIQALYNGAYNRGCAPIAAGRAIAYLPVEPTSGVVEQDNLSGVLANTRFIAYPNPFKGVGNIAWSVKAAGNVTLKVYDPSGRVVRNLVASSLKPGRYSVTWDGKANDGRMVSAGIYFYQLETATDKLEQKVIVTR
jgi:hypothetical protein